MVVIGAVVVILSVVLGYLVEPLRPVQASVALGILLSCFAAWVWRVSK